MEIPRYWRNKEVRLGFKESVNRDVEGKLVSLDLPGGSIPLSEDWKEVEERLYQKGYKPEVVEKILEGVFGGVATEATIPTSKTVESFLELFGTKVREKHRSEV